MSPLSGEGLTVVLDNLFLRRAGQFENLLQVLKGFTLHPKIQHRHRMESVFDSL